RVRASLVACEGLIEGVTPRPSSGADYGPPITKQPPRRGGWFPPFPLRRLCTPAPCSAWASGHFSAHAPRFSRKPSETSPSPLAQGNPAAAAYASRELDDHSFRPEDIASMSAALDLLRAAGAEQEPRSRRGRNQDARNAQARRASAGAEGNSWARHEGTCQERHWCRKMLESSLLLSFGWPKISARMKF